MNVGPAGRVVAGGIAAITWASLILQFVVLYHTNPSALQVLWILAGYFTILTNLVVAMVFTGIAANSHMFRADAVIGGTMLSILLVGIVYALLLHGTVELSGGSVWANVLLHMVTPALVPLFWIFLVRKGGLGWRDPLLWAIYPLLYLVYGLTRGGATGKYAYPFLNVLVLGWQQTIFNAACVAGAFMLSGFAVVWVDHRIGSRLRSRV